LQDWGHAQKAGALLVRRSAGQCGETLLPAARNGALGSHQWRDGAPMELPTPTVAALFGAPLRAGTMIYELVAVEGDALRLGANSGGKLALTPADRPTELEDVTYARQQL
jgi:hypothetical protein